MRRYTSRDLALLSSDLGAKLPAPVSKKRSREESIMQCSLLKWWHLQCRVFGVSELLLFSIPNGGGRSGPVVGSILKSEGLRKGAPDLMLAVPRVIYFSAKNASDPGDWKTHFHGLFLELKRRDGRLSPEQEVFHSLLRDQGYKVVVCWSLQECINEITTYLTK